MTVNYVTAVAEQKFTEAVKVLDGAIASCNDRDNLATLLINRGFCQQKVQLYRKALKDYEAALAAVPGLPVALYRKGQVLAAQKKLEEARLCWNEALQACNDRSDVQLVLDISAALRDPSGVKAGLSAVVAPASVASGLASAGPASATPSGIATPPERPPVANGGLSNSRAGSGLAASASPPAAPAPAAGTCPGSPSRQYSGAGSGPSAGTASLQQQHHGKTSGAGPETTAPGASTTAGGGGGGKDVAAAAAAAGLAAGAGAGECPVEEVDCVAAQQRAAWGPSAASSGGAGGPAGGSGGGSTADMQAMLNNSMAIQLAVTQINAGNIAEAEAILDKVVASTPRELGARVARGTARALRRDLKGAVDDFSVAIDVEPRYSDSWKRRGQARSALGDHEGALADLQKAIDLAPLFPGADSVTGRAECWVEKGMIYQKMRDYRRACRELQQAVRLDATNPQAWNLLGLCSTSQGDIRDGVRAYEKAVELNPRLKEAWVNMGQALKEEGRTKEAERVLLRAMSLDPADQPPVHVLRVLAQMKQQKGEHAAAVKVLDRALPLAEARDEQVVEVLYLRAICHHALGAFREAIRDYEECLNYMPKSSPVNATEESRQFQFLSYYQKDMALYLFRSLDRKVLDFCPDSELPAVFKELWCKKGPPTAELISHYPPQPPLPLSQPPLPPAPNPEQLRSLTVLADQLGVLLQNNHQGFLPNVRQQRAAGYAAVELAQALREAVAARRAGRQHWVRSEGSSGQAGSAGRHLFGWRDAMDLVVKWRQLSEPNDQVVWVDLLTRREFEQGFGSHTPMFSGQTKCVRYYMNFARALELQREVLLREGHAFDANNRTIPVGSEAQREAVTAAKTAEDMYMVIQQDSWVVVPIHSVSRADHQMEGTRLTLVKVPNQPDAYEFSIRTPVTPPRWKDFDAELEAAFEAILQAFADDDMPQLARCILTYCYYWYNFMPLARGTAAVGYTTMLSMFWAAGMPVTARIPKDYQVDWEAILAQHPTQFIAAVSAWLYPPQARGEPVPEMAAAALTEAHAATGDTPVFPPVDTLPSVAEVLSTVRQRIIALNGEGAKRYV